MAYSGTKNLEVMADARRYNAFLLRQIRGIAPAAGTLMDFGAGSGTFAGPLADAGVDVVCLEPDPSLGQMLRARGLRCLGDLSEVPDGSLDVIYSMNVLEHIADDEAVMAALHRKLKAQGVLLLYVPAFPVLFSSMDRLVGHLRRYRRRELAEKLTRAGFGIRTAAYTDSLGFLVTLLYKAIGSREGTINRRQIVLYDRVLFPVSRLVDYVLRYRVGKNLMVLAHKGCGRPER